MDIGSNNFQASGIIKIAKSLQRISSLTKLYIYHNNLTYKAADDIAAAISCNVHLQELDISKNDFQTPGIIKIAKSLQTISLLTKLYINHNNLTYEAADDIATVITYSVHLQELDISSNDFQASSIRKIAKSLQKISSLRKLYINHNNITYEAADIAIAISCNTHLQELDIGSNDFQASGIKEIAKSLQKISSLTKLYINHNNVTFEAADDIAAAISCNTHLQELDIGSNKFTELGAVKILRSLQTISTLTKLYIYSNKMNDKVADDIASIISCNIHLQEFNISWNYFTASGAIKFAQALQKISTLQKLCISGNDISDEAADDIAAAITSNPHLQELDIGRNGYVSGLGSTYTIKVTKGLQKISKLKKICINYTTVPYDEGDDMAAAISCNIHLQELNIDGYNIQKLGAIKIARSLQKLSTLTKLNIRSNNINDEAAYDIANAISCNIHLQELNIAKNNLQALGTIKISEGLKNISTLTKLCLRSNNITDDAAGDIATVITCNVHLQELDIGINKFCGPGAVEIATALHKISTLVKLYIDHNNISDEAADAFEIVIDCNRALQEFAFYKNGFTSRLEEKLKQKRCQLSTFI